MQPTIDDAVIKELGIQDFSPEQQQDIVTGFYLGVRSRMSMVYAEHFSDEQFEALQALMEKGNDEEVKTWLDQNLPNHEELYANAVKEQKEDLDKIMGSTLTDK